MIHTHLIEGRLAAAPRLGTTPNGVQVGNFRLLYNDSYRDSTGAWKNGKTRSIDVACWRDLAERVQSLNKGDLVLVEAGNDLFANFNGEYTNLTVSARNVFVSMRYDGAVSNRQPKKQTGNIVVTGDGEHFDEADWAHLQQSEAVSA